MEPASQHLLTALCKKSRTLDSTRSLGRAIQTEWSSKNLPNETLAPVGWGMSAAAPCLGLRNIHTLVSLILCTWLEPGDCTCTYIFQSIMLSRGRRAMPLCQGSPVSLPGRAATPVLLLIMTARRDGRGLGGQPVFKKPQCTNTKSHSLFVGGHQLLSRYHLLRDCSCRVRYIRSASASPILSACLKKKKCHSLVSEQR